MSEFVPEDHVTLPKVYLESLQAKLYIAVEGLEKISPKDWSIQNYRIAQETLSKIKEKEAR